MTDLLNNLAFPYYPTPPYLYETSDIDEIDEECQSSEPYNVKMAKMMEFVELSSHLSDSSRPEYITDRYSKAFLHQIVALRMMVNNPGCLILYPPGSGKSCTSVNIPEYIKKYGTNVSKRPGFPNRVYIFQRGPSVIADIKNQIVNVCAPDVYNVTEANTSQGAKRKLTNTLTEKSFYTIKTYKEFSSTLLPDDMIEDTFSDSVFIIDEAHNIVGWNDNIEEDDEEGGNPEIMTKKDTLRSYKYIHKVIHMAKRVKVIVMTATPMINNSNEFAKLLNLLLPMSKQIKISGPGSLDFNTIDPETFRKYTEGMIMYVPDRRKTVIVREMGEVLPYYVNQERTIKSSSVIQRVPMIGVQRRVYLEVVRKMSNKPGSFYLEHKKASGFVFPDGTYDGKKGKTNGGLYKYITRPESDKFIPHPSFLVEIRARLPELSAKFAYVIDQELNPPRTVDFPDGSSITLPGRGCSYYYFELVTAHAIPFTACLDAFGFERYNDAISPFITIGGKRQINLEKKPRYIFITKDNVNTKLQNFKDVFNSDENVFGEYVQIIIGSRIIKDGINIFNVARIYINPLWNPANMTQAMSRAKRLPGHDAVVKASQDLMRSKGIEESYIQDWKFELQQHKMSSYIETTEMPKEPLIDISVDDYFYIRIIENKSKYIDRIMNMAMDVSVDKYINGTAPVDFAITPETIDYNNFDAKYSESIVGSIKDMIYRAFSGDRYFYSYMELKDKIFKDVSPFLQRDRYILSALDNILDERAVIRDRYNNKTWINIQGSYIFISNSYPDGSSMNILDAYYYKIIPNETLSISDDVRLYCEKHITKLMDVPYASNSNIANTVILEKLVIDQLTSNYDQAAQKAWWYPDNEALHPLIRRLLKSSLYVTWKPYDDILSASYLMSLPSVNKGVKATEDSVTKLKSLVYSSEPESNVTKGGIKLPLILFHTIDSGNIRILNTFSVNNLEWEYTRVYETPVYSHIVRERNIAKINALTVGKLYGIVDIYEKFVVGRVESTKEITDKRLLSAGKECSSIQKSDTIAMLREEGVEVEEDVTKQYLCKTLKETLDAKGRLIKY